MSLQEAGSAAVWRLAGKSMSADTFMTVAERRLLCTVLGLDVTWHDCIGERQI